MNVALVTNHLAAGSRACALASAVCLAGTSAALGAGGPQAAKSVKIGVIADLTARAAAYGQSQKNAYALATTDLKAGRIDAGGGSLTFDVRDAVSDPARAARLAQGFAADGSALLIGPTLSIEARRADPIAVAAGLTILGTSNTASDITSLGTCVFRDALSEEQLVNDALARVVTKWRVKTAAIVYGDDNAFTRADFEIFKAALAKRRVTVLGVESYRTGDAEFKTQLASLAAKKPNLLIVAALLEEAAKIVVEARQFGIESHIMGGNGLNSPRFGELAGEAADGVVIGTAYSARNTYAGNADFVADYARRFGQAPDQFAAQAYAAAQITAAAVKRGATSPAGMCAAFKSIKSVSTVLGPVNFLPSGELRAASTTVQVTRDGFTDFY